MAFYARNIRFWSRNFLTMPNTKGVPETEASRELHPLKTSLTFDQTAKLSGIVTKNSAPVERKVLAISSDGLDIRQTQSDINGNYEIVGVRNNIDYNLVAIAETEGFVSKAQGPLTATPYILPAATPTIEDYTWTDWEIDNDYDSVTTLLDLNQYQTNTTIIDEKTSNNWQCFGNTVTSGDEFKFISGSLYIGNDDTGNGLKYLLSEIKPYVQGGLYGQVFPGVWRPTIATGNIGTLPLSSPTFYTSIGIGDLGSEYGFIAIGYFRPPFTGTYTIYTTSDDGSGVWIGNLALPGETRTAANATLNNNLGGGQGATERSATVELVANTYYPIRIVHEEGTGGATLSFNWAGPSIAKTNDLSQYFYYRDDGLDYYEDFYSDPSERPVDETTNTYLPGDFTIECFIYITGSNTSNSSEIVFQRDEYRIYIDTSQAQFLLRGEIQTDVNTYTTPGRNVSLNSWHHIALVRNSDDLTIYVDGFGSNVIVSGTIPQSGNTLTLGANDLLEECMKGYIDYFRITKGVARYTADFTPPIEPYPVDGPV